MLIALYEEAPVKKDQQNRPKGPKKAAPGPKKAAPGPKKAAPGPKKAAPGPKKAAPGPKKADDRGSKSQTSPLAPRYQAATRPKKRQSKPVAKQTHADNQTRLNKAISETGHCSRREADTLIEAGRVKVNGRPATMGQYVDPTDRIEVDRTQLKRTVKLVYLALNKPEGIECTTDTSVPDNIVSFMRYPHRIYPVGRLDKASDGLLLLTNDGDIVNKILRAGNAHEKEYIVTVDRPISPLFLDRMRKGVPILDTVTKPCKVYQEGERVIRIVLTQGLNRQIRRMCEALGYQVKKLTRVRIMHVHLGDLKVGKWRHLTSKELEILMDTIKHSTNDQIASED